MKLNLKRKKYTLEDDMPIGKHEGKNLKKLIYDESLYVLWMLENTDLRLDKEARRYLKVVSKIDKTMRENLKA